MRPSDVALIAAVVGALIMAVESRNHVDLAQPAAKVRPADTSLITCPLRKPEFATVMQAAFLGDGTLLVEQQTSTKVRHIKDC